MNACVVGRYRLFFRQVQPGSNTRSRIASLGIEESLTTAIAAHQIKLDRYRSTIFPNSASSAITPSSSTTSSWDVRAYVISRSEGYIESVRSRPFAFQLSASPPPENGTTDGAANLLRGSSVRSCRARSIVSSAILKSPKPGTSLPAAFNALNSSKAPANQGASSTSITRARRGEAPKKGREMTSILALLLDRSMRCTCVQLGD